MGVSASPQLSALLGRLQDKALQHRVRVGDFFVDYDKHRDGTVTEPQFLKALNAAYDKKELGLSEGEAALLVGHYAQKMPHGATHVQWRRFVADVEAVFGPRHLEKDPAAETYRRLLQQSVVPLPHPKEELVQHLLADLRRRVEV